MSAPEQSSASAARSIVAAEHDGRLLLGASHPDGVVLLDSLFPGAWWVRDDDDRVWCKTGITVQRVQVTP